MSERLRLEAEFRDRGVQAGIRKIGTELETIKQTPGMTQATKWVGEFNDKTKQFGAGRSIVTEFMTGLALGGLSAAVSVAGLVKTFTDLANRTADLKEVSRQTGLTVDQVNRLQRAGEQLYIDPSKMTAGLETLSDKMFDFRRHMGELYGELNQFDPDFARKLSLEKPEEQIKDIFGWLSKIKDPQLQRRWTEAFMGDGDLARLLTNGGRDFAQAMQDAANNAASITPDMQAKADLLHKSILDFNHEWEDFGTTLAPAIFDQMRAAMSDFKGVFDEIKRDYDWIQNALKHPGEAAKGVLDNADKAFNDKANEVGDRWRERLNGWRQGSSPGHGEDGNALRRNDETPAQPSSDNQSLWGRLFHRSSFSESGGAASMFGNPSDAIADGTKQGVLAAFREMMGQRDAERAGGGGMQNAAFETWDSSTGRPGSRAGAGGGDAGGLPPARGLYDAISQAEGTTKEGFNTTLGYGKWAKPSKPLTEMTLDEVKAVGLQMRRAQLDAGTPWNATSSASGKFQITGSTMMDAARALGLDPSSAKFDGPTQERMAAWIAKTQGLSAWEGFKSHPGQISEAQRALRAGDLRGSANNADAAARSVDIGIGLNGASRDQAARALGARLTPGEWCADFVNGALNATGRKGVNSSIANSFLGWGREVAKEAARKGDVLVEDRGRGVGASGGHVGLYTGQDRVVHGRRQMEMLSGNYGDRVQAHDWVDADKLHARREFNLPEVAAKAAPEPQTFKHEGGASIDLRIRSDGSMKSGSTKAHGMITAVNLSRAPTMMTA